MKKNCHKTITFLIGLIIAPIFAHAKGITGLWETIDDRTSQKKAIVQLSKKDGKLQGNIVKVYFKPGDKHVCEDCSGKLKNAPVEGLRFLWGLKEQSKNHWGEGSILDPHNGKIYRARLNVTGDKIYVRAYLGVPLLGRTQIWHRYHAAE